MNQAHILIMHRHSEIRPLSTKAQSVHLSAVYVRALHLGVEPAERCHLAEHCQSADTSTQPPARRQGSLRLRGRLARLAHERPLTRAHELHTTPRRARAARGAQPGPLGLNRGQVARERSVVRCARVSPGRPCAAFLFSHPFPTSVSC